MVLTENLDPIELTGDLIIIDDYYDFWKPRVRGPVHDEFCHAV